MAVEIEITSKPIEIPLEEQQLILGEIIAILRNERHRWLKKRQSLLTPVPSPDTMETSAIAREGGTHD